MKRNIKDIIKVIFLTILIVFLIGLFFNSGSSNLIICSKNINGFLEPSIPFFHISLGKVSCVTIDKLKWFFEIEGINNFDIVGIRWWLLFFIVLIILYRSNKKINKLSEKVFL